MITAVIVGGSGYSGAEVLRLLSRRADVTISKVTAAASAGQRVAALYPALAGQVDLSYEPLEASDLGSADVAFVALPSGEGMKVVPQLLASVPRVIDLGGDFRLQSVKLYERYYRHVHAAPELLQEAVYGLPELNRGKIASARLIANPGCYPTGALLALLPALRHGFVAPEGIVIDSMSGVSGAGRSSSVDLSFSEVNENLRAYKVGVHQHIPEIESVLSEASGSAVTVSFVPHLVPITRGIYTTIHARLVTDITESEVLSLYEAEYGHEPFVRVTSGVPQIQAVAHTNYCDIGLVVERRTGQLILMSVLDNLIKGAAGQAIQNMNIMLGIPEQEGLT